jgi:hypothetical protein
MTRLEAEMSAVPHHFLVIQTVLRTGLWLKEKYDLSNNDEVQKD